MNRRKFLAGATATATTAAIGISLMGSGAAAEVRLNTTQAVARTDDGDASEVGVNASDLTIEWQNYDTTTEYLEFDIRAKIDGHTAFEEVPVPGGANVISVGDNAGTTGSWSFGGNAYIPLYTGEDVDPFDATTDGEWNEQTVTLAADVTLLDGDQNACTPEEKATISATASLPVKVLNEQASASGSGTLDGVVN